MKKSDEIKRQIQDLLDRVDAIQNLSAKENRDLTEEEQSEWDRIMKKVESASGGMDLEKSGDLAKLESQLAAAVKHEDEVARVRAARQSVNAPNQVFDSTGAGLESPPLPINLRIVTPTLRAFKGQGDRDQAMRDAYDTGLWFKATLLRSKHPDAAQQARDKLVARRGNDWFATQNETTPTDGGYLVPPQFENAVIVYREQVGVARRLARVIPMMSDSWTGLKQTSGTAVYYPGEEGAVTPSDANFARYTLSPKKRAILAFVSRELRDDALPSIMDLLAQDMGHQFALKEDQEFVVGDGTGAYGGVQGVRPAVIAATASIHTAVSGEGTWPDLTLASHLAAISLVADKYRGLPLSWLCSAPYKWQVMDRLALAQGGAIMQNVVNGQPEFSFLGYPVVTSDRMPTTTAVSSVSAIFGAFGNAVILGDRQGIAVDISEHFKFDTDQISVRATTRYDINVHEEGNASTAGAVVGLKTAAS